MFKRTRTLILGNKLVSFLFCFSLIFFLYQHTTGISWDFSSYVLNAKYIFSDGGYFEWYRPPLASVIIGLLSVFGWIIAEYLFIIFVLILHLFSSFKFSNKMGIDVRLYYALSLSPFFFIYGMSVGTEILSLALIQLFLSYLDDKKGGIFFGLAFLTRYQNLIFLPLLFFKKNLNKIYLSFFISLVIIIPWLLFNLFHTGDAFTSLIESYALNIKFRTYALQDFNFLDLVKVGNILIPFFIGGIIISFRHLRDKIFRKNWTIMILFFVLSLYSYYNTPLKIDRYLFSLIIPLAYFSTLVISKQKMWIYFFVAINLIVTLFLFNYASLESKEVYLFPLDNLDDSCALASNYWVPLNYLGYPSEPAPDERLVDRKIEQGYRVILSKEIKEPAYTFDSDFLDNIPVIYEDSEYIILGNESKCAWNDKLDNTYFDRVDLLYNEIYNKSFSITPFEILFTDKQA